VAAPLRMVNARTAEQWAEIIQAKWQDSVTGIMETGLALDNAREELGATVFWKMVRDDLKFAHSTATKLQRIGTSAALMECSHGNILPAHWPTLYALACLTDEQFQRGLDTGVIHAGMERKDVAQLKPPKEPHAPKPEPSLEGRELIERRTLETRKQIVTVLRELNPAEQLEFIALLRFQLDDLEKPRQGEAA
jgi:hypothetical protein